MLAQVSPSVVIDWEGSIEAFLAPVLCKGAPAIERVLAEDQFAAPPLEEYRPMVESRQDPTDESPGSSPQSSNSAGASPYSRSKTGFRATTLAEFAQPNPVAAIFTEYHRCLRGVWCLRRWDGGWCRLKLFLLCLQGLAPSHCAHCHHRHVRRHGRRLLARNWLGLARVPDSSSDAATQDYRPPDRAANDGSEITPIGFFLLYRVRHSRRRREALSLQRLSELGLHSIA